MNAMDRLVLLAELEGEDCALRHGPGTEAKSPAVDCLVLPIGFRKDDTTEISVRELVVPVCVSCVEGLLGEEWTLLYCMDCGESRWVYRQTARLRYRHHILWLKGCPDCGGRFGGLYFNDLVAPAAEILVRHQHALAA